MRRNSIYLIYIEEMPLDAVTLEKGGTALKSETYLDEQLHLGRKLLHVSPAARLLVTCNNTRLKIIIWIFGNKEKSLILPRCTSDLVLVVQQNLTSAGVVSRACCHGERRCVRPHTLVTASSTSSSSMHRHLHRPRLLSAAPSRTPGRARIVATGCAPPSHVSDESERETV